MNDHDGPGLAHDLGHGRLHALLLIVKHQVVYPHVAEIFLGFCFPGQDFAGTTCNAHQLWLVRRFRSELPARAADCVRAVRTVVIVTLCLALVSILTCTYS